MAAEEKEKGFVIKDRRIFSEEGGEEQAAEKGAGVEPPGGEEPAKTGRAEQASARSRQKDTPLPEINFATFVASLNASALVNLGVIADPASGKQDKNLPMAKQTIDIISMLQEKTAGNLNKDEESILKSILYDLRIMYVKEKK